MCFLETSIAMRFLMCTVWAMPLICAGNAARMRVQCRGQVSWCYQAALPSTYVYKLYARAGNAAASALSSRCRRSGCLDASTKAIASDLVVWDVTSRIVTERYRWYRV
jgi:hypothetical protein